jgi:hypothetical protein
MNFPVASVLLGIALALPANAHAGDLWAFVSGDASAGTVSAFGQRESYTSYAGEFGLQYEWNGSRYFPQAVSIGFRKETLSLSNGTYLVVRGAWRSTRLYHGFLLIGTLGVVYGAPSTQFDRTTETESADTELVRTHFFAARTTPVPFAEIRESGVILPELSLGIRKTLMAGQHRFHFEPTVALRPFTVGVVRAEGPMTVSTQETCFMFSVGIRIGFDYQR